MTDLNNTIAIETSIACQNCGQQIELTEALAKPFLERSMSGARREIELLRIRLDEADAKEAQLQAARTAIELEKSQLQLTVSAQVNDQLTAVRAAVAGQYQEQIEKQKRAQQDEVASLKLLVDAANAKEAQLQVARTAIELEKSQLQLTISAQVNEQLATVRAAVAGQYEVQIEKQKQAQPEEVASLKLLVDAASSKEAQLQAARTAIELEKSQLHLTISAQVNEQLTSVRAAVAGQYEEQIQRQRQAQQEEVAALKFLVDTANAKQQEFENRLKQRDLELKQREEDLNARHSQLESDYLGKWEAKRAELIQQGMLQAEHKVHLHIMEKNILIDQLQGKIRDLEATAFQGSQQIQGEALEREVESRLRRRFSWDQFLPVRTGSFGADLVQSVNSNQGVSSGKIIWECKNTKHWNQEWLKKIKQDQLSENANAAVIVSVALPDGFRNFDLLEDVWVCSPDYFLELATAIRFYLCEVFAIRKTNENKDIKNELLFSYVTGQQFRTKFKAIIEMQKELKEGLEKEKKLMTAAWSKREKHLDLLLTSAAGVGGDLTGILGKAMKPIDELEPDSSCHVKPSASQAALQAALQETSIQPERTRFISRS